MSWNVNPKRACFFVMWGLVFAPCVLGCAGIKGFFNHTSDSEKTGKTTFFERPAETDDVLNSYPVTLYDEDEEKPQKSSFWSQFSLKPVGDPDSEHVNETWNETEPESEIQEESSLLAEAEKAEKLQEYDKAERLYRQFLADKDIKKTKSESAKAYGRYGTLLARKGDYETSERMHLKSLELNPNDHEIAGAYAQALYEQKKYADAAVVARNVLNSHGEDPRICYFLGESLLAMHRYQEGFRYLKKAIGEPEARVKMAQAYHSNGDIDAARYAMQKHDRYYFARGMNPPMRSPLQAVASAPSQGVAPPVTSVSQNMSTTLFPSALLPVQAPPSASPPNQILPPPVLPTNVLASSYPIPQGDNPLSQLQSQRKPSPLMPQTQTQNASVNVATSLTLSQTIHVDKESKIE